MRGTTVLVLLGLFPALCRPLAAQAWDSPTFLAPRTPGDVGVYVLEPDRSDWGLMALWRQGGAPGLGVRAGVINLDRAFTDDDWAVLVGAEAFGPLARAGGGVPVDLTWLAGVGAVFDGATRLRIPAGLSVGRSVEAGAVRLVPYAVPRAAIGIRSRDDDTDVELEGTLDLALDVHVAPEWMIRLGWALGDGDALGVGVAWRFGRRAAVR